MILTREKRLDISKRLAALCIIAVHDQGIDHDCCDKIIEHTAEIAYSIGGVNMKKLFISQPMVDRAERNI